MFAATQLPAIDKPSPINNASITSEPYSNTGIVYKTIGEYTSVGSGHLINNRVVLTASHVIFDTNAMAWETGICFHNAFNQILHYVNGSVTSGSVHLESFSSALAEFKKDSDYKDGLEDGPTFNSDIAALYALHDFSEKYGTYMVSRTGEPSAACEEWETMLLGYPVDSDFIRDENAGQMHQTGPNNWTIVDIYGNNDGSANVSGVHTALFANKLKMVMYGGNSGGPLFVYDSDDGQYTEIGIALGGKTDESDALSYFRIIDEEAESLIKQAITTSGANTDLSATTLSATGSNNAVNLSWTDSAKAETGWEIRRNDGNAWNIIATADANTTSYTDTSAQNGITYEYEIRAVNNTSTGINKGPWCKRASAAITSAATNTALAKSMGAPYLCVTSSGDAPFYAESDDVRSGKILNNQHSVLTITVTGPGTFSYNIATSTESGYDKVAVTLDGTSLTSLSGNNGYASKKTITISSAGSHTIAFTYAKDIYTTSGDDCIYIKDASYYCSSSTEAVQGGKVTSGNWRYSTWLGHYYDYGNHWIYSYTLGYLYVFPVTKSTWESDLAQWVYFDQGGSSYDKLGWGWIGMKMLPSIWSSEQGWVYYYEGTSWIQEYDGDWIKLQ